MAERDIADKQGYCWQTGIYLTDIVHRKEHAWDRGIQIIADINSLELPTLDTEKHFNNQVKIRCTHNRLSTRVPTTVQYQPTHNRPSTRVPTTIQYQPTHNRQSTRVPTTVQYQPTHNRPSTRVPTTVQYQPTHNRPSTRVPTTVQYQPTHNRPSTRVPTTVQYQPTHNRPSTRVPTTVQYQPTHNRPSTRVPATVQYQPTHNRPSTRVPTTVQYQPTHNRTSTRVPTTVQYQPTHNRTSTRVPTTVQYQPTHNRPSTRVPTTIQYQPTHNRPSTRVPTTVQYQPTHQRSQKCHIHTTIATIHTLLTATDHIDTATVSTAMSGTQGAVSCDKWRKTNAVCPSAATSGNRTSRHPPTPHTTNDCFHRQVWRRQSSVRTTQPYPALSINRTNIRASSVPQWKPIWWKPANHWMSDHKGPLQPGLDCTQHHRCNTYPIPRTTTRRRRWPSERPDPCRWDSWYRPSDGTSTCFCCG